MSGASNGVTGNSICNSSQIVVIFCVFVYAIVCQHIPLPPLSLCVCVCVCVCVCDCSPIYNLMLSLLKKIINK